MSETVVAKRYAEALFQLGIEKNNLDELVTEFTTVRDVFQDNKELNLFLLHPAVSSEKKKELIAGSFTNLQKDVVNTLKLLIDRHRTVIIPAIIDQFIQLVNNAKGIVEATVYSTRALSENEKRELELSFAKRLNKTAVTFDNKIDSSLIGGIKIRVGNTIYDGTISGKLKNIERKLMTAN
ncbi:F0F1 ATP synthase subunit delta [Oceanobacillus chungangensis]|uniref:ATP synthase subunit delta n=1 Tax=Oceanobacillus chungangensis TaxID=1229152 RepID=A0A3D8PZ14_9BACI|nr:F0F1 ATP synthase subunit delta [Oceanobacillus chungangensis]RDW20548.1 F0F1 ATP synthase subunit delta [Oceanobacillus chungangensis]